MSKERAKARAAREAERAREKEKAAKARARKERIDSLKPSLPTLPKRRRRYGAMALKLRLGLAFGWLVVQWLAWQMTLDTSARVGIALLSLFALPIVVVLTRTPPRGS